VHDFEFFHVMQRHQYLNCEPPDETFTYALKIVQFDKLVKVHREHFETDHKVFAEDETLKDPDYIFLIFWVALFKFFKDASFY